MSVYIIVVLVIALIVIFFQYGFWIVLDFKLAEESIDVIFLRFITIMSFKYKDIIKLKLLSESDVAFGVILAFKNKIVTKGIEIERNNGFLNPVVITPSDIESFAMQVYDNVLRKDYRKIEVILLR